MGTHVPFFKQPNQELVPRQILIVELGMNSAGLRGPPALIRIPCVIERQRLDKPSDLRIPSPRIESQKRRPSRTEGIESLVRSNTSRFASVQRLHTEHP